MAWNSGNPIDLDLIPWNVKDTIDIFGVVWNFVWSGWMIINSRVWYWELTNWETWFPIVAWKRVVNHPTKICFVWLFLIRNWGFPSQAMYIYQYDNTTNTQDWTYASDWSVWLPSVVSFSSIYLDWDIIHLNTTDWWVNYHFDYNVLTNVFTQFTGSHNTTWTLISDTTKTIWTNVLEQKCISLSPPNNPFAYYVEVIS